MCERDEEGHKSYKKAILLRAILSHTTFQISISNAKTGM